MSQSSCKGINNTLIEQPNVVIELYLMLLPPKMAMLYHSCKAETALVSHLGQGDWGPRQPKAVR